MLAAIVTALTMMLSCAPGEAQESARKRYAQGKVAEGKPAARILERKTVIDLKELGFDQILSHLSGKLGLSGVCNGDPLLIGTGFRHEGTVKDLLDKIGETFDLKWSLKGNVILFARRFSLETDRPQTHVLEMSGALKDMLAILPPLAPVPLPPRGRHSGWGILLEQLWHTLTPAQLKRLRAGDHIAATDLEPAQFSALNAVILHRAYGEAGRSIERGLFQLNTFGNAVIVAELLGTVKPVNGRASETYQVSFVSSGANRKESEGIGSFRRPVGGLKDGTP